MSHCVPGSSGPSGSWSNNPLRQQEEQERGATLTVLWPSPPAPEPRGEREWERNEGYANLKAFSDTRAHGAKRERIRHFLCNPGKRHREHQLQPRLLHQHQRRNLLKHVICDAPVGWVLGKKSVLYTHHLFCWRNLFDPSSLPINTARRVAFSSWTSFLFVWHSTYNYYC